MISRTQRLIDEDFIKKPGEHLLVIAITGAGKTNFLIWLTTRMMALTNETIVWFDIGKKTEAFFIPAWLQKKKAHMGTKIITPPGCEIQNIPLKHKAEQFLFINEVWEKIEPNTFNIISIQPFIIDPLIYTKAIDLLFRDLIRKAHLEYFEDRGIGPLALVFDEFHNVAPAQGHTITKEQGQTGAIIQMNIEKLRAFGIRIIGSTHGETKIRRGVRISFNWRVYRRTSEPITDIHRLQKFEEKIQKLKINEAMIVFPTKEFQILDLEEIKYPSWYKNVRYRGLYEEIAYLAESKQTKRFLATIEMVRLLREQFTQEELSERTGLDVRDIRYFENYPNPPSHAKNK
jgi:hypothetical protein